MSRLRTPELVRVLVRVHALDLGLPPWRLLLQLSRGLSLLSLLLSQHSSQPSQPLSRRPSRPSQRLSQLPLQPLLQPPLFWLRQQA
ncbi:hypothetical protein K438DRAFT_1819033, partial [Mycena galopus ATCC 62051]